MSGSRFDFSPTDLEEALDPETRERRRANWEARVKRWLGSKRGKDALRRLLVALDALPSQHLST